jgi:signal transduction histidine kinase
MARDLHDTVTKDLHGVWLICRGLETSLTRGDLEQSRAAAALLSQTARGLSSEAREVIQGLRETGGGSLSLSDALAATVRAGLSAHGTELDLTFDPAIDAMATRLAPARPQLLAVVGEAVHNVAKHAEAQRLWLAAEIVADSLWVTVRDDGVGFDPQEASCPGHYGLAGMSERMRAVGGSVEISSRRGDGVSVSMRLPLSNALNPEQEHAIVQ